MRFPEGYTDKELASLAAPDASHRAGILCIFQKGKTILLPAFASKKEKNIRDGRLMP
jgi:hypothetical protein